MNPIRREPPQQQRIMVVDDEPENIRFIVRILRGEGYGAIETTQDPREAAHLFATFRPDLVLMDLLMPHMDGVETMARLRSTLSDGDYVPFLVLTSDASHTAKRHALEGGATDFLTKPFSPEEIRLRIRNLLDIRALHRQTRSHALNLEERVSARTRDLEEARQEMLHRLARAAEFRDDETGRHTARVGELTARLALELGMPQEEAELLGRAAQLHDVGKIGIPDRILLKRGKLAPDELAAMEEHTRMGARILSGSRSRLLRLSEEIALSHHEWWDGSGYPGGLAGEDIPLPGRIVAVADVFDSLTHRRHYKPAWTPQRTAAYIREQSGRQFDPAVVEAFARLQQAGRLEVDVGPDASGPERLEAEAVGDLRSERQRLLRRLRQVERLLTENVPGVAGDAASLDGGPADDDEDDAVASLAEEPEEAPAREPAPGRQKGRKKSPSGLRLI